MDCTASMGAGEHHYQNSSTCSWGSWKAAVLEPHLTIKPVDVRQHSKGRDSLCQSSANSLGNLLKAAGVAK